MTCFVEDEMMTIPFPPKFIDGKKIAIVGVPFAEGQPGAGVLMAPKRMREMGLYEIAKRHKLSIVLDEDVDYSKAVEGSVNSKSFEGEYTEKEIENVHRIGPKLGLAYEKIHEAHTKNAFTLVIGGDHSIAAPSIAAAVKKHPDLCCLWIDAHGDCNTPETSPTAHYHGMPAAHVMGLFKKRVPGFEWMKERLDPSLLAFIGLRQVDDGERTLLRESGVHAFSMQHVDRLGIHRTVTEAIKRVNPKHDRPIHLSLDIDAVDPSEAPGTGTLARGGLTFREIHYIVETIRSTGCLVSMDMVEVDPESDAPSPKVQGDSEAVSSECTQTVRLALGLCESALGSVIV